MIRIHLFCLLALSLSACAPAESPPGQRTPGLTLSATDISDAMGYSMGPAPDDLPGTMCAIVEDIQCSPAGRGRLQCSFRQSGHEERRTALFKRTGKTEWERRGHWIWVRGWRWCGRYF